MLILAIIKMMMMTTKEIAPPHSLLAQVSIHFLNMAADR